MPFRRPTHILALTPLLAIAAGCLNTQVNLDDHDRFTPGGRISYEILPGLEQRRDGALLDLLMGPSDADYGEAVTARSVGIKPTLSIDGEIAGVEGRDHQHIAAGEQVELDVIISGPARVKLNTENLRGHIAARGGVRFFDVLSLEAIMGVGIDSTEVRLRGNGFERSDQDVRAGFLCGGRATIRAIPLFDLYTQYTVNVVEVETIMEDLQVGVELNFSRNLSVFTGYRWWQYRERNFDSGSDVELDIRGPTAGVSLKF